MAEGYEEGGCGSVFVQLLHRFKKMVLQNKDRKIANFFDCLKLTQSLHLKEWFYRKKIARSPTFFTV